MVQTAVAEERQVLDFFVGVLDLSRRGDYLGRGMYPLQGRDGREIEYTDEEIQELSFFGNSRPRKQQSGAGQPPAEECPPFRHRKPTAFHLSLPMGQKATDPPVTRPPYRISSSHI